MKSSIKHTGTTCLIVEDDDRSGEFIASVLTEKFKGLHIYKAENLEEAEEVFYTIQPQLLFLDINLPDGNSFELLEKIYGKREHDFKVIFITAYADYAVEAFRYSALDFLLKPVTPKEIETAVKRVIETLQQETYYLQLEAFFQNYRKERSPEKKIVLKTSDRIHVIKTKDICYAQADNNYTVFSLEPDKKIVVSQPLKVFEEKLSPLGFMRVHQSYLVNFAHVVMYRKKEEHLVLNNGSHIPVSKSKKAGVLLFFDSL
ncbi:LytR/AlgR family response regulator transcription factor [Sinomicrobium weinanense]|uniref:Response regulator transcription factor n=1 Tax=Sinomicrobium weinanense TaxID=2842200 RepID=A0A926JN30_9FLAO|nr:LytTR family DNA-binding domain-containing protein [Sinomicrobium weinanense]MBC9794340.1 response regulator transcription factor [Sinomicrobium weinanense]MBU3124247.1 LytTR family DNA-binding domain-containing protein [Sinomicrobium weinanense]